MTRIARQLSKRILLHLLSPHANAPDSARRLIIEPFISWIWRTGAQEARVGFSRHRQHGADAGRRYPDIAAVVVLL